MPPVPHPLLPSTWNVPDTFRQRLGTIAGRQRAMTADGHLLLVLHELPNVSSNERVARLFWRAADGSWKSGDGETGSSALDAHLRKFAARVEQLEAQEDQASRAVDYFELLQQVVPLFRTARNLHATLQQARDAVPTDRELIQFRDQAGELERAIELLHADIENGLRYTVAHQAEEQAKRANEMAIAAHRLNVLGGDLLSRRHAGRDLWHESVARAGAMECPLDVLGRAGGSLRLGAAAGIDHRAPTSSATTASADEWKSFGTSEAPAAATQALIHQIIAHSSSNRGLQVPGSGENRGDSRHITLTIVTT